jgi:hypothetical protein
VGHCTAKQSHIVAQRQTYTDALELSESTLPALQPETMQVMAVPPHAAAPVRIVRSFEIACAHVQLEKACLLNRAACHLKTAAHAAAVADCTAVIDELCVLRPIDITSVPLIVRWFFLICV